MTPDYTCWAPDCAAPADTWISQTLTLPGGSAYSVDVLVCPEHAAQLEQVTA